MMMILTATKKHFTFHLSVDFSLHFISVAVVAAAKK